MEAKANANANASNANAEAAADREVVIQRVFDAPARLLFLAYSKPEHITRWFGPKGWPVTHCEMDFRKGGQFRFAMTGPDGKRGPLFGGHYLEIVPDEKIVYDNGFLDAAGDPPPPDQTMVVTVTFVEAAGKTTLTLHTLFGSKAMHDEHVGRGFVNGTGSGLDQLGDVVRDLAQREGAAR
jgi:uncharacterized protein YndB with AHSA1/START domain